MPNEQDIELHDKLYNEKKYAECLPLIDKLLAEGGLSEKRIVILMFTRYRSVLEKRWKKKPSIYSIRQCCNAETSHDRCGSGAG